MSGHARELLLTGGDAFLGRTLAEKLAQNPAIGRVTSVHPPGSRLPPSSERLRYVTADLGRNREVRELLFSDAARTLDCIVHVPSRGGLPPAPPGEPTALVAATQRLLLTAEEHPHITRFVMVSSAEVYRIDSSEPILVDEDHPLALSADAPEPLRDLIEADLLACARIGVSRLHVAVLRCAPMLAPGGHGQLADYLASRVCLRPLGFDPMLNVLALEDAVRAVELAALSDARGIFNVPGRDSLPLSELIHAKGRLGLALPGPALIPLYTLRALATGFRFHYARQRNLFHFGAVLDGRKAEAAFGYRPMHSVRLASNGGSSAAMR